MRIDELINLDENELRELFAKMSPHELGKIIIATRKIHPRKCEKCGKEFLGFLNQRFCTDYCRRLIYQKRKRKERKVARLVACAFGD